MENKKNKRSDLSRRSILFFQLGLIIALFSVWQLIEWKVEAKEPPQQQLVSIDDFAEEVIPITQVEEVKPVEPPQEIVEPPEIIEDDKDVIESIVASTEGSDEPMEVEDVKVVDEPEEISNYSIMSVEEVPVYPGCEGLATNEERKICMSEKINNEVTRNFDTEIGEKLGLTGVHRIYVSFKIEPSGKVSIIGARGPHPKLEEEAIRVAKGLPQMQPGKQGGKPVGVIYSLPIIFKIQD